MLAAFANAFRTPDLRKKIFFTLAILAVFRLGSIMPTPNVNVEQVSFCLKQATTGEQQGLYSLINLFSGGALLQLAIFALGIMPYITASIILQLLTVVIPRLEALKKEGQAGQTKITQYTRYLTLVLAVLNSTAFVTVAVNDRLFTGCPGLVYDKSIFPVVVMILTMTAGTGVIMWLGELITERGVGNGMSVLIFTQIAATFPSALWSLKVARPGSQGWVVFLLVIGLGLARHARRHLRRTVPAPDPGAVRQADGGPPDVRRHHHLHPDQGQPGRRHPGHLCFVAAVSSGSLRPVPAGRQVLVLDQRELRQGRPSGLHHQLSSC